MGKKVSFKVVGYAALVNERDIEVVVKAETADAARAAANEKEPSLVKHKDVRIYTRSNDWKRVV